MAVNQYIKGAVMSEETSREVDTLPYDYVEQDGEYLNYLAEIASKEMKAEYLPDAEDRQKMLDICESIHDLNNQDETQRQSKELAPTTEDEDALEVDVIGEDYKNDANDEEYNQYLDMVHNETLAKILSTIEPVDLIKTLQVSLGDQLGKYLDKHGRVEPLKVPNKLYIVAIIFELNQIVDKHGWGFAHHEYSLYVYTRSYWEKITSDKLKRFLSIATMKLGFYSPSDALTSTFVNSLLKQYQDQVPLSEALDSKNTVLVNLENGTFEVNSNGMTFREHRKQDFIKHQLPYKYNKEASAPRFMKYLNRVLPDKESQLVLQEFHGYIFTRHLKLHKALILYGTGANGKSVMYEITRALLGEENISTKSFGDLIDGDSGNANRASLQDKLLNFGSEIGSKKNMSLDIFKKLVSGEAITARQKYEKSIEIDGYCKFIFNANELPDVKESTEAYYRRLLIIPYNERILDDEQDPELERKIIDNELPGIFNWVLDGLESLLVRGKFSHCQASDDIIEDYKTLSNSLAIFLEEKGLTPDHNKANKVLNKTIFTAYDEWRKEYGEEKISASQLSKRLQSMDFTPWKSGDFRGLYMNGKVE